MTVTPLPAGFRITVDADTKRLSETILFGGSPARVLRLVGNGVAAWRELQNGPAESAAARTLARRLSDAGLVHPVPPPLGAPIDVTIVIPVHDRATLLDRCLAALGSRYPVLVVDDASTASTAIAEVARRHGARLLRRAPNGGPGAARNTGLAAVSSEFVAFIDSDCVAPAGWIDQLATHLQDPLVGAVAPRITTIPSTTSAGRFTATGGSLDLGDRAARVAPGTRVAYVPTAALLARRAALDGIARAGEVFDPALRVGEDVDVVWRLDTAGWRVRYDPAVQVAHHEPDTWPALLARRFSYGTSAAPLAHRHPAAIAPLVLQPLPTLAVAALLARRPSVAAVAVAASAARLHRTLRRADIPTTGLSRATAVGVRQTWLGAGRYATQFAAPVLAVALIAPGRPGARRSRWGRRAAALSLLLGGPLTAWRARRPALDPVRFTLGHLADDIAYGAGVWAGCLRHHTTVPLRPRIGAPPLRLDKTKGTP